MAASSDAIRGWPSIRTKALSRHTDAVAAQHVVKKGLVDALDSLIVRSIFKWGARLAETTEVLVAVPTIVQGAVELHAEYKSWKAGACRSIWDSK